MTPRVSLGVPVYNGERHLEAALDSLVGQTFTDLEIVISDNGSTDSTPDICRRYAAADDRIRYVRHDENRGATWNFNHVLSLCGGEFYKWAAHDDVVAPQFVERCVEALDRHPDAVLAFGGVVAIDDDGEPFRLKHQQVRVPAAPVARRFQKILSLSDVNPEAIFGLMRRSALLETRGQMDYAAADHTVLVELALRGWFVEVPELLFFNRDHPGRSVRSEGEIRLRAAWFDPANAGRVGFPTWRYLGDCARAVADAPLDWRTRAECWSRLPWFVRSMWKPLLGDLAFQARQRLRSG